MKLMEKDIRDRYDLRMVRPDQAEEAAAIEAACFPPEEACPLSVMKERARLAGDSFLVAIDRQSGRMAGFINGLCTHEETLRDELFTDIRLHEPKGDNVMICSVSVLPDHRGQGLAREMMKSYLIRQTSLGRKRAVLTCVPAKVAMYEKFGFTDLGPSESTWGGESWHEMDCFLQKKRCRWCRMTNPIYIAYHDEEWGRLRTDDPYLFEMLILESFQAGLSWECILNKRENFRRAYDGFALDKVCAYDERKEAELLADSGIVRNRLKIRASVKNARIFREIVREYGSFWQYLDTFVKDRILYETDQVTNALSDAISVDLKKRGMTFVGSTIIYAYLQAIGVIHSHEKECFLHVGKEEKL